MPFNPSDPDVKKVGSQGMSNGQDSIRRSASNNSLGPKENGGSRGMMNNKSGYLSDGEGYKRNPERPGGEFFFSFFILLNIPVDIQFL